MVIFVHQRDDKVRPALGFRCWGCWRADMAREEVK
jgi:hypothetical protein